MIACGLDCTFDSKFQIYRKHVLCRFTMGSEYCYKMWAARTIRVRWERREGSPGGSCLSTPWTLSVCCKFDLSRAAPESCRDALQAEVGPGSVVPEPTRDPSSGKQAFRRWIAAYGYAIRIRQSRGSDVTHHKIHALLTDRQKDWKRRWVTRP